MAVGSSTEPLAVAARRGLELPIRFRRMDQGIIEDIPVDRRKIDFLACIDNAFRRRHGVDPNEIGYAGLLVCGRPLKLALGARINPQVHAVTFDVG